MKKLFYALILIGLVGCGKNKTAIPDNLRVYESVYDQEYHFDGAYGAREIKPFGGMFGKVKQITEYFPNGSKQLILFHENGLIDEIKTSTIGDEVKYSYKYSDDVLLRTIWKNESLIYEDTTYYMDGLPTLRESRAGTEVWGYDNEGRMTTYHRNDTLMLIRIYMPDILHKGKWIEEYRYNPDDDGYSHSITYFNNDGQITERKYSGPGDEYLDTAEYEYNDDGSYNLYQYGEFYWHCIQYDKFGNYAGDRRENIEYEYDYLGNWIKKISESVVTEEHSVEYREIIYWDEVVEEEIIPIVVEEEIIPIVVEEEEIIPITSIEQVKEEAIPYQLVDVKPSFQGGDINHFTNWVNSRLVYPEIAKANGIQGRVTLQFTVEKDGSVTEVKVVRGVDPSLEKEAVRVVSMSPKWSPGRNKDRNVPVIYTFPVIFSL